MTATRIVWILSASILLATATACTSKTDSAASTTSKPADVAPAKVEPSSVEPAVAAMPTVPQPAVPSEVKPPAETKPAAPAATHEHTADAEDAIKKNGPIFVDWPKPKLAIAITGDLWGYFEPCGCAGLENQKGGMSRRHTLFNQLRADGWPLVAVDVGGLAKRLGEQAEIKFQRIVDAFKTMQYSAIGWGPRELQLSNSLVQLAEGADGASSPFVSANVSLAGLDLPPETRVRIVEAGGKKLGITSVLGDEHRAKLASEQISVVPAEEAVAKVLPALKGKCDLLMLLVHAKPAESERLAAKFPEFQIVVTAEGGDEPPHQPKLLGDGKQMLIEVGHKGMHAVVLGWYDDAKQPWRYQRVPLDHRFADSPEMKALMASYQEELKVRGWEGLGALPKPHPRSSSAGDPRGTFVGDQKCGECHTKAFEIWKNTPHAHATDTLVNLKPPRHFDAECISCHATGWNAQEFFPFASGFVSVEKTPHLKGNGCENCHGPGAAHVAAEESGNADMLLLSRLRDEMKLPLAAAENDCRKCHDLDNSPAFDFESYWPQVEHKGKD